MADSNNNNVNKANSNTSVTITGNSEILTKFSPKIFETYKQLALQQSINAYNINAQPVSGVGENSYGFILQVCLKDSTGEHQPNKKQNSLQNILKISPKNPAFRAHGRIVDLYTREVFMYQQVFSEFYNIEEERVLELKNLKHCDISINDFKNNYTFDIVPEIIYASLADEDEFIIFEDLNLKDYKQNLRTNMPTYDLVCATFRSIAKLHAMSFILQKRKPEVFKSLVQQMSDNLFTVDMEPLTVEFGKKYIKRTRLMLEQDVKKPSLKQIQALKYLEQHFKEMCLKCVDGKQLAPYAVICHGDFWNNNILYKYNVSRV